MKHPLLVPLLLAFANTGCYGTVDLHSTDGIYVVTFATHSNACGEVPFHAFVDGRYVFESHPLPLRVPSDSGAHGFTLTCLHSRTEAASSRFSDTLHITGDTTIYIDCDSCMAE